MLALKEEGKNVSLETSFILCGRGLLVRVLTPLTAVTPTIAEPTHSPYFSLSSLLPTFLPHTFDRRTSWLRRCAR